MTGGVWVDRPPLTQRRWVVGVAVAWIVVCAASALSGCAPNRRKNESFCDGDQNGCPPRMSCDVRSYTCVQVDASAVQDKETGSTIDADARLDADDTSPELDGSVTPDVAAADADPEVDGSADVGIDAVTDASDGPRSCGSCPSETPICNTATGMCGACTANAACAALNAANPFCETGRCVGCRTKADCPAATPLCDATTRVCKGCETSPECAANSSALPFCNGGPCVECLDSQTCTAAAKPICDATIHACAACTTNMQCATKSAARPACSAGTCVECNEDKDCPLAQKPICAAHACVACTSDAQCEKKLGANPGVCMFHADGRCATDSEVLYVVPVTACDDSTAGTGSVTKPFCTPQRAITAVSPTKSVVVIRPGMATLEKWTYTRVTGVSELTVIGQKGASIGPGVGVGITINSGNVYLRGLTVNTMLDLGMYVPTGDTMVRLDRCVFTKNKGGVMIDGAGFEINNSVFAENYNNNVAIAGMSFGGVYLGGVGSKAKVFRNNTIYKNEGPGVVCGGPYVVRALLVANNIGSQVTVCDTTTDPSTVTSGTTVLEPQFDPAKPYHQTPTSPCVDKGSTMEFPPDDLDGNPRPSGTRSDCGAHELQQ